jgi:hypothetical protein
MRTSLRGRVLVSACVILSVAAQSGCGDVIGPSSNRISEFSGVLQPFGESDVHEFTVRENGEFEVRLSALDPSAGIILQVLVAQFVGNTCTSLLGINFATLNNVALAGAIGSGRYCAVVFDEGLITQPVTYTLRVSHPR